MFGPYRLDRLLGAGGMGEVFEAYDTRRDRVVAVKRLHASLAAEDEFRARFQQESALAARLREPHVIPIHDYGEIDGQLFIDMRLVEGSDLSSMLAGGGLDARRAVDILSQVSDALDAAHADGLVHRDIKPSNILVVPRDTQPGRDFVYLVDFGIARVVGGHGITRTGTAVGTTAYMAPERYTGGEWDHRVDVYALACVLFECLTGRQPFPVRELSAVMHAHIFTAAPRVTELRPDLPAGLDDTVARGMAKQPEARFDSAGALMEAARAALHPVTRPVVGGPVPARSDDTTRVPAAPPPPRHPGPGRPPPARGPGGTRPDIGPAGFLPVAGRPPPRTPSDRVPPWPGPPPGPGPDAPPRDATPSIPADLHPVRRPVGRRRVIGIAAALGVVAVGGGGWAVVAGLSGARAPWVFATGDKVYSSPAVVDGTVLIGSNDGNLYALAASDGSPRWTYDAGGPVTSSPTVAGGVVFVGGNAGRVHAVDLATGSPRWTFPVGEVLHSSPTVAGDVVYVGARDGGLHAIDAVTGGRRWRFGGGDWFNSSPAVAAGRVFIGCRDRNVYAVDAATGELIWARPTDSTVDSSPTVTGDIVHIGGDDGMVRALRAADGEVVWQFATGGGVVSTPAVQRGVCYVGSDDAVVYALEADTGRERWRRRTGGGVRSSPAVVDGRVYVGSQDRFLYALSAVDGTVGWRVDTGGPVDDSSPAVDGGFVYVGTLAGAVLSVAVDGRTVDA